MAVYTWKSFVLYGITKPLRIADKDNRLRDERGEDKGDFPALKTTIRVDASWHKTYEYDPLIKIALPAPVGLRLVPRHRHSVRPIKTHRTRSEAGDAEAQYLLARRYAKGQGVTRDLVEAVKWYRKATDQNYANARQRLGLSFPGR